MSEKLDFINSGNDLLPIRDQASTWSSAGLSSMKKYIPTTPNPIIHKNAFKNIV